VPGSPLTTLKLNPARQSSLIFARASTEIGKHGLLNAFNSASVNDPLPRAKAWAWQSAQDRSDDSSDNSHARELVWPQPGFWKTFFLYHTTGRGHKRGTENVYAGCYQVPEHHSRGRRLHAPTWTAARWEENDGASTW
jgi:hypothetical protein